MFHRFAILCAVLSFLVAPAFAHEDEGLYDPLPPENAAFVRFVHGEEITPYTVKMPGSEEYEAGKFYTVVSRAGEAHLLKDHNSDNRAKALLLFYNLTDRPSLSLKTADGAIEIVGSTPPYANGYREVNAVRLDMAIYDGEKRLAVLPSESTQRGAAYSVFALTGEGGGVEAVFVQSTTETAQ